MDNSELHRRLAQAIQAQDDNLNKDAQAFLKTFIAQLRSEGWKLDVTSEVILAEYLQAAHLSIKSGIATSIAVAAAAYPVSLASDTVAKMAENAFTTQWPDGITLSERLWKFDKATHAGVNQVLQEGIRQGAAAGRVVMAMQRSMERAHGGQRFKIIERQKDDWVKDLYTAGQNLINDPEAQQRWTAAVSHVEEHILQLAETSSRAAAGRVLEQIKKAVDKGSEELMDKAVRWWVYDKQLYHLKRIARTEMTTAGHRAIIASTVDDEDIIGYQWRLSSSHPRADICDYYASIEMGLGKGVWSKEAVPGHKAHPHCMCLLVPRVLPIQRKGSASYSEFIENASPDQQAQLLPKWAQNLRELGVPVQDMVRDDGLWTNSRKAFVTKMGEQRFKVASVLGRVLTEKKWMDINPKTHKKKLKQTINKLSAFAGRKEVKTFLNKLEKGEPVGSLDYHYLYRRYADGENFKSKQDYVSFIDDIVRGENNKIFLQKSGSAERYAVLRESDGWLAIVDAQTHHYVTAFRLHRATKTEDIGEYLWKIKQLIY